MWQARAGRYRRSPIVAATIGVLLVPGCASTAAPTAAPPSSVSLVSLGDSIPAGSNCAACTPFGDLLGAELTADDGSDISVTDLGVDGWTSEDLLEALGPGGDQAGATSTADVVTVTIGANDFYPALGAYLDGTCGGGDDLACFSDVLPELRSTLTSVLDRIYDLDPGRPTVLVTGYWNVFTDGDVARQLYGPQFVDDSAVLTRRANDVIADVAQDRGAIYVDLFSAFKGPRGDQDPTALLGDDGDHPNQDGHRHIADALAAALADADRADYR